MKATCWMGKQSIEVRDVPDPRILNQRDAIVRITSTAICGSDLHLYNGFVQPMKKGDILGHEFMGEVMEVGRAVKNLKVGDRVVVPFTIACGECWQCQHDNWSLCENSNPNAALAEKAIGHSASGAFGYSHLTGGFAGGQAEFVRVPFADVGPLKIENGFADEQVLFLSDILPTGYMGAEMCDIKPGDTVAVWGCGPVGQMAIRSAILLGAAQVIAIDRLPERLSMAEAGGAIPLNFETESVVERLNELTDDRGPDKCIDATGLEAHVSLAQPDTLYDRAKQMLMMESDRAHVLREMIYVCRPAGVISIPGVYSGLIDKMPMGIAMNKGLTFRMGQTHVKRWADDLVRRIEEEEIDPSFVITHTVDIEAAPEMYKVFRDKRDSCVKVVVKP
jgi:threonine dehydrogenase-like Zn-dependent dehydrogenase